MEKVKAGSYVDKTTKQLDQVVIRLAGDSGDGMQLAGLKFTTASVIFGNDVSTLPDFPAEIRAPSGTLAGVSGFQVHFSSSLIYTPGDALDALVAMNPAALKVNISDLKPNGILIINEDTFTKNNISKAGYSSNPIEDGSLDKYRLYPVKITSLNEEAVASVGLKTKQVNLTRNFFALGLISWLYDRPLEPTIEWVETKFKKRPAIVEANIKTLKAGYYYGETNEFWKVQYQVPQAEMTPGLYRYVSGTQALALGFIAATQLAKKEIFYGAYPITPASDLLHELVNHKGFGIRTFQAEDEIAAIGAAIGAAFGGSIAITGTSGPGFCLKSEAFGLAVMTELPLIVVNVQRAGPSTGMPTKNEQADLLQVMYGRNGESPAPVLAPQTPSDCFDMAIEAIRIAMKYMTPVVLLLDGYLANNIAPWKIPRLSTYPAFVFDHPTKDAYQNIPFLPYGQRDPDSLARPWAIPGTPGLEHRIGGLEKDPETGNVSYDPLNHERMVRTRAEKVDRVSQEIPPQQVNGPKQGDLLILSWGSTFGVTHTVGTRLREEGYDVADTNLRFINPFPSNLGEVLRAYKHIVIPELNLGQLLLLIRSRFPDVQATGINKVQGRPFQTDEIYDRVLQIIGDN
ncbi:MAG: 2-oxoacid:acceptor oxidoreductase subunit alpha [Candidatus Heimdallarchaeota archaeon]